MNSSKSSSRTLFGLPKLPAHSAQWVTPLLLSVFMTCIVSIISTLKGVGMAPGILRIWLGVWALSWVIAFPTLLLVLPLVKKATALVVEAS
ncbi:MAG: DUF2798 domain-containing protein [Polaromonas sp.]|uniref:DUF2798 domain-containing protein n=1 Tax=Polaromonas sp. TaxID=1869339 RepID=UPI0032659393